MSLDRATCDGNVDLTTTTFVTVNTLHRIMALCETRAVCHRFRLSQQSVSLRLGNRLENERTRKTLDVMKTVYMFKKTVAFIIRA